MDCFSVFQRSETFHIIIKRTIEKSSLWVKNSAVVLSLIFAFNIACGRLRVLWLELRVNFGWSDQFGWIFFQTILLMEYFSGFQRSENFYITEKILNTSRQNPSKVQYDCTAPPLRWIEGGLRFFGIYFYWHITAL